MLRVTMFGASRASYAASPNSQRLALPLPVNEFLGDLRAPYLLGLAALVGLYYGAAHLGYWLGFSGPVAAIVWLPVGVGISFLYLGGLQFWPGVVIGDLLVNNYSTLPVGSALAQSVGNLLEVVVATILLRRLSASGSPLATVKGLTSMVVAIASGTLLSAMIGSTALWLGNVVSTGMWPHVFRTWLLGDFSGALLVLPLALAWLQPPRQPWLRGRWPQALLLLCAVVAISEIALHTNAPLAYLVFPPLIWAAISFDQRGATIAVLITAGFTIWGTTHFVGPFAVHSFNARVLNTQLYIAVASLSALAVAALVSERETMAEGVRESRARLVETADLERQRLERNLHDGAQQRLVALAAHLSLSADQASDQPDAAPALFEAAEQELLAAIDELRELAHGIHPPVLSQYGLDRAFMSVVARSSIPIEMAAMPKRRLDSTAEATAYYVLLEAVTNAQKYARATRIRVNAVVTHGVLRVEVSDDGIGGATEQIGLGLQGLRDRVEATGGHFRLDSRPGHGTRVNATVPATLLQPV